MILGIGNDLVHIDRIDYLYQKYDQKFLDRICTAKEQKEILKQNDPTRRLALHFAAKEATAKALGTGLRQGVQMVDIEVLRDKFGKPQIHLHGGALKRAKSVAKDCQLFLALTDEQDLALATVILTSL